MCILMQNHSGTLDIIFNRDLLNVISEWTSVVCATEISKSVSIEQVFTSLAPENDFSMRPLLHLLLSSVDTWHSQQPHLSKAPGRATCLVSSQVTFMWYHCWGYGDFIYFYHLSIRGIHNNHTWVIHLVTLRAWSRVSLLGLQRL